MTAIGERTAEWLSGSWLLLRSALREFFPAVLEAFDESTATDTLELLAVPSDPEAVARLSGHRIAGALKRARRDVVPSPPQACARWFHQGTRLQRETGAAWPGNGSSLHQVGWPQVGPGVAG